MIFRLVAALAVAAAVALGVIDAAAAQDAGTSSTAIIADEATTADEIFASGVAVYDKFTVSIVMGIEALLTLLSLLCFFPPLRKALKMGPEDRFDAVPYGIAWVAAYYTAVVALLVTMPWYIAALTALGAALASPLAGTFIKHATDEPGEK